MMLPVLLPPTIEIFSVLVLLDSLEDFATKTSTNVRKIILVATVEHALTPKEVTLANAGQVLKEETVSLILMIAQALRAKTEELVLMALEILNAYVLMVSVVNIVSTTSMNVLQVLVKMVQPVTTM